MTLRYFHWLNAANNAAFFKINPFSFFWYDSLAEMLLANVCAVSLPVLIVYDIIMWSIESSDAAAKAREAQWEIDHQDDLRFEQAQRARKAYLADLRIAELIDEPDTREMAIMHANNKYHRRLADIMEGKECTGS